MVKFVFCAIVLAVLIAAPAAGQATLIVPGKALGDLTVEMALAEIKTRLGEPDDCQTSPDGVVGVCTWQISQVWVSYDLPSMAIRVLTKNILGSSLWRTDTGIGSLSTSADVVRAHGKPDAILRPTGQVTFRYVDAGIQFSIVDSPTHLLHDRVFEIGVFRSGRFPKP